MKTKVISLLLLTFILIPSLSKAQYDNWVIEKDSLALIDIWNNLNGENWESIWHNFRNWDQRNYWVVGWTGIGVNDHRVDSLNIGSLRNLKGTYPTSIGDLTALRYLNIYGGTNVPTEIGNLIKLEHLEISVGTATTIPSEFYNFTNLKVLSISGSNLTGNIPAQIGNFSKLESLSLYGDFSGNIPEELWNLTNLKRLYITNRELEGPLPPELGNLTNLESLNLYGNELNGNLPTELGNLSNLTSLHLASNNIEGPIPSELGNLTKLETLRLGKNNLSGDIPMELGNLTNLHWLHLYDNNLESAEQFEIGKLTKLEQLYLQDNNLNFRDLEKFTKANIDKFSYAPQGEIKLKKTVTDGATKLSMDAGGTQTSYQWFYNGIKVAGETTDTCIVQPQNDKTKYHCEAKNSLLPELVLTGKFAEDESKDCWETGSLTFCLSSGEWEKGSGTNKIKTTDIISINDFLFFDGTMSIDTTVLEIEANGKFYIKSNKLPADTEGNYTLSEGEHNLKLLGDDGKLTNFLNSTLTKTAMLFGTPLKINDLQLVKRQDTLGIKIGCSVNIPKLSVDCGFSARLGTDIELKNLEITNVGITEFAFSIDNLGFIKKDYCLKNATLNYDWKKDVLVAGTDVSLPFFADVAGGIKIEKGSLDSVAWGIEGGADKPLLKTAPIGLATFGVKGFYGHVAGIKTLTDFKKPNLIDLKIGGVFSDVLSDNLYQIKADGNIIWPTKFKATGEGKLLKLHDDFPFQIAGKTGLVYSVSNKQLKIDFDGKIGTRNEQSYLLDAAGGFTIDSRTEPTQFSGRFGGDLSLYALPEIPNIAPFNWISSFVDLSSVTLGTRNTIFSDNLNLIHGLIYFHPYGEIVFSIHYIIDMGKEWTDAGFISSPKISRIGIAVEEKSGLLAGDISKSFAIPENTEFGIIEIKTAEKIPTSSITSPTGEKYANSSPDNNILYSESSDKKEGFWSILNPQSGDWTITLEDPAQTDSIFTIFQLKEKDFKFSMNQTGHTVTVSWDVAQVEEGQKINLMLDDDNADYDGFSIAEGDATLGSLSFTLDESTPDCNYYLFVQLIDEFSVVQSYADEAIDNPLATLAPPENLSSEYNSETGEFNFTWTENPTSEITGYILSVTDELGNDSIYAILNSNVNSISLFIEDFETKSAKIESYNQDWKIGCPTTALALSTSLDEHYELEEPDNKLNIFPNPTTGNLTIRYFVSEDSNCEIRIFDIQGRQIAQPLAEYKSAGFHQLNFNYERVPNGLYIIKFINGYQTFTVKSILSK